MWRLANQILAEIHGVLHIPGHRWNPGVLLPESVSHVPYSYQKCPDDGELVLLPPTSDLRVWMNPVGH